MRIYENGVYRDLTDAEIRACRKEARRAAFEEKRRSMSQDEVSRLLIERQINGLDVDDNTALRMQEFYPVWAAGESYPVGRKLRYGGRLWRVMQAHTSQTGWEPDQAASLFETINETHEGTEDDPIPYSGNMALVSGLIYAQGGEFYRCIRDTGNPVYHNLADLVGLYVEVLE